MILNVPDWFFVLNILTACFGFRYFFGQAHGIRCSDKRWWKLLIIAAFVSCGVTLFFSVMMLLGVAKYSSMFLFFSWFSVGISTPFLRWPRIMLHGREETIEDLALIEKPDELIKRVKT